METVTDINLTGSVTQLSVQTDAKGAVVIADVEEDTDGQPLLPEQWRRLELRLAQHAIEHLAAQYRQHVGLDSLYLTANAVADLLDERNGTEHEEMTGRLLKVGEAFNTSLSAWIRATSDDAPGSLTILEVADALAEVVVSAVVAMTSYGVAAETVLAARVAKVAARTAGQPPRPTGQRRPLIGALTDRQRLILGLNALHRESIQELRDNLAALRWWQWRRRRNIEHHLAGMAVALIRETPYVVQIGRAA